MSTAPSVFRSSLGATEWEPFPVPDPIEGEPDGKVHWLRNEPAAEPNLMTGLFTAQPSRFPYTSPGDETFHLLEGSVTIEMADGSESFLASAGDLVSFPKGAVSTWTVHEPITEFFVISGWDA